MILKKDIRLFYFYSSCIPIFFIIYDIFTYNSKITKKISQKFKHYSKNIAIIADKKIFIKKQNIIHLFSKDLKEILQILIINKDASIFDIFLILKKYNTLNKFLNRLELNISDIENLISKNKDYKLDIPRLIFDSIYFASQNKYEKVYTEIFIYKIFTEVPFLQNFLDINKITFNTFQEIVKWEIDIKYGYEEKYYIKNLAKYKWIDATNKSLTSKPSHIVNQYTDDLTLKAKSGNCDIIIGYEEEYKILLENIKKSNKPTLIVGNSSSGKTAIIEYLALQMASEEIDDFFKDKRLLQLNIGNLISGTNEGVNEIAKRVSNLCKDIINATNIILVIEDVNLIAGDMQNSGNFNILNIILSYIDNPNFKLIATINTDNYIKKIKTNSYFSKFNVIELPILSYLQIKEILKYKIYQIEKKINTIFSINAINTIIEMSKRYIQNKNSPGKEIFILEQLTQYISKEKINIVTSSIIKNFFSYSLKANISDIQEEEKQDLKNLEKIIHKHIIGQDEAVEAVANALKRARLDLRDENKPIASFLFLGPTGVGKTELAKVVTQIYFKDEKKMIRIDMSEYQEKKSLYRLIGDESNQMIGTLTEQVALNPFSLILLDEIEKANSDIFNLFLQILDDGYCHDGYGKKIFFNNTIIICTSNAAANEIQKMIASNADFSDITKKIKEEILINYFKPEFLNRFTKIVFFKPLTEQNIFDITKLLFEKQASKLAEKSIYLKYDDEAIKIFAKKYYDIKYGARPIKHAILSEISDKIADMLLDGQISKGDTVLFTHENNITKLIKIS